MYLCSVKNHSMQTSANRLNPIQLHLIEMFNYCDSESSMSELKDVLAKFYAKQVQEQADRMWDEGVLDEQKIEQILDEHLRTPYTNKQ